MGLSLISEPDAILPAYAPVKYTLRTNRKPNGLGGEGNISIVVIAQPTAVQLATFTDLRSTDVLVQHNTVGVNTLSVGQSVLIEGTANGLYSGKYTVTKNISQTLHVIDTSYVGPDTGGTISKYYDGLTCLAYVTLDGVPVEKPFSIPPKSDGTIEFDLREVLQRQMTLTLDPLDSTQRIDETDSYTRYSILFKEGFLVPTRTSPNFYIDPAGTVNAREKTAVMATRPYAHTLAGQETTYSEGSTPYLIGSTADARFLTYLPRGEDISIGRNEFCRLGMLFGKTLGGPAIRCDFRVRTFRNTGTLIAETNNYFNATPQTTMYATCGPKDLGAVITAETVRYSVQVYDDSTNQLSERLWFRVDPRPCGYPGIRFHWRNRNGDMDSFYFGGKVDVKGTSSSIITQREALDDFTTTGVYSLREARHRTSNQVFTALTEYISPEVQQWLATELVQSPEVYIVTEAFDKYIPVIIEDGDAQGFGLKGDRTIYAVSYRLGNEEPHHVR